MAKATCGAGAEGTQREGQPRHLRVRGARAGGRGLRAWPGAWPASGAGGCKGVELPLEAAPAVGPEARRALSGPSRVAPRSRRAPACRGRADGAPGPARPRRALFLFHFPSLRGRRSSGRGAAAAAAG